MYTPASSNTAIHIEALDNLLALFEQFRKAIASDDLRTTTALLNTKAQLGAHLISRIARYEHEASQLEVTVNTLKQQIKICSEQYDQLQPKVLTSPSFQEQRLSHKIGTLANSWSESQKRLRKINRKLAKAEGRHQQLAEELKRLDAFLLQAAIKAHKPAIVELFLKTGMDRTFFHDSGTPLHTAAYEGHEEICRLLVASPSHYPPEFLEQKHEHETATMIALRQGHIHAAAAFLSAGAKVPTQLKFGTLFKTLSSKQRSLIEQLPQHIKHNWKPLHFAAAMGLTDIFLQKLYDTHTNVLTQEDYSPVQLAAQGGEWRVLQLLAYKDETIRQNMLNYACPDSYSTALHLATHNNNQDAIATLLALGADPMRQDRDGNTILHIAALNQHASLCQWLNYLVPQLKVTVNWHGQYPCDLAKSSALRQQLLARADMSISASSEGDSWASPATTPPSPGQTNLSALNAFNLFTEIASFEAIHFAAATGNLERCKTFIEQKSRAIFEYSDKERIYPLHLAALNNHPQVAQLICDKAITYPEYPGRIEALRFADNQGRTPQNYAVKNHHYAILSQLASLKAPANPHQISSSNQAAAESAFVPTISEKSPCSPNTAWGVSDRSSMTFASSDRETLSPGISPRDALLFKEAQANDLDFSNLSSIALDE